MPTITLFAAATQATGQQLDDNLTLVSNQAPIPCTVSGTNAITMTQSSSVYTVTAYAQNMQFSAVAVSSNTAATTARLGSLSSLPVYKDTTSGPVALSGGEIIAGNAFTLVYDAALNGGGGGFHLFTGTQAVGTTINPTAIKVGTGSTLSRYLTATSSVSFSVFAPASSQESIITLTGVQPLDAIILGPPSMANAVVSFFGFVPASGSVAIRAVNADSVSVTLTAGTVWRVTGIG